MDKKTFTMTNSKNMLKGAANSNPRKQSNFITTAFNVLPFSWERQND